jgi:hypothetical protein
MKDNFNVYRYNGVFKKIKDDFYKLIIQWSIRNVRPDTVGAVGLTNHCLLMFPGNPCSKRMVAAADD